MKNDIYTLSVDQAEKCGYAIYKGNQLIKHGTKDFSSKDDTYETKIHNIKQWFKNIIKVENIAIVVLEDVFMGFNADGFKKLSKLLGVLENYCYENEILQMTIKPVQWRKIGIKGRKRSEQKESTIAFIKNKFHIDVLEDEADAIAMGYYFVNKELPKVVDK